MKKLVSVLLAFLMAAGLGVVAMAQEGETSDLHTWVQRNPTSNSNRIARDGTVELRAAVQLPSSDSEGELSVEWFVGNRLVGTDRELELVIEEWMITGGMMEPVVLVRVAATFTLTDENGDALGTMTGASTTTVYVALNFVPRVLQILGMILISPLVLALPLGMFLGIVLELLIMIPLAIPMWIWYWITGLFG
ncbi:MAG: hypothetical protein FWE98_03360 [Oscillospiraceae bacterium]|nr:hypothetical protein [Oscillospiraceae bacterium]